MTANIPDALRDANDALELAELGLAHILDDIDVRTGKGDARLIVASEAIAIARSHIGARTLAWERLEREDRETIGEHLAGARSASAREADVTTHEIEFKPAPIPQAALDNLERDIAENDQRQVPTIDADRHIGPLTSSPNVSVRDMCRELDVSESQFYRWIHSGRIKTYKRPGKRTTYVMNDDVHMLRAIAATFPPNRTSMAAWITKSLHRAGR